jgi:WG containing repeat
LKKTVVILLWMVAMAGSLPAQQVTKPDKLFRITKGHLFGFIDRSGRIVVDPRYEDARSEFSEGSLPSQSTKSGATLIEPGR